MLEAAFMKDERVSPDERNRMKGGVERDADDWAARMWTGKRSLKEQRELMAKRWIRAEEQNVKGSKSDIAELAADFWDREGYLDSDLLEKAHNQGYTSKEFRERVRELREERKQSRLETMQEGKRRTKTRERIRERVRDLLTDVAPTD